MKKVTGGEPRQDTYIKYFFCKHQDEKGNRWETQTRYIYKFAKNGQCTFLDASRATEHASRYTLVVHERLSWKHYAGFVNLKSPKPAYIQRKQTF